MMELSKKFLKLFEFQINTGKIDPEIPALLTGYQFPGLTKPDDKVSLELAKYYFDYLENKYVNCYRLFAQEDELILIDRKYSAHSRRIQSNAIMILNVPVKHDFEFTDDGCNLFNPDIKKIAKHEKLTVYFDSKEAYQRLEPHLQGIVDHYDRFNNSCGPMSFFSYPQMNLLGYHINGGLFEKEELDNIINVMKELKHKGIDL
jgi:hypothetical protein